MPRGRATKHRRCQGKTLYVHILGIFAFRLHLAALDLAVARVIAHMLHSIHRLFEHTECNTSYV